jgi:hypothetical protein
MTEQVSASPIQFSVEPRIEFKGTNFTSHIVFRSEGDVIFQFFELPKRFKDFEPLLAEAVEGHFGTTDNFALAHVPELKSWALLAKGLQNIALFNQQQHITKFLELIDLALTEVSK